MHHSANYSLLPNFVEWIFPIIFGTRCHSHVWYTVKGNFLEKAKQRKGFAGPVVLELFARNHSTILFNKL